MKKLIFLFFATYLMILGCDKYADLPPVISIAISSDGKYAVSVNDDKYSKKVPDGGTLVLWDIENKTNQILAKNANVFSVSFVPGGHEFIWQDDDDMVHIQTVEGTEVEQFKNFKTYGQVIDEDKLLYLSSDEYWRIFKNHGGNQVKVKYDGHSPSYLGTGKVINLSIGRDYFLSAGGWNYCKEPISEFPPVVEEKQNISNYCGVVLWDKTTLKPLAKLNGNVAKTVARISPDGKWVVGGDESAGGYMWSTTPPYKRTELLTEEGYRAIGNTHSIVFMDDGNYFLIIYHDWEGEYTSIGIFKTGEHRLKKLLDLRGKPRPCVAHYQRNLCTASAPDANILVTGQEDHGGINVYKFHPDTLTLEPVWIAK